MKPDDIILGQFYVIDEIDNEPPNLTAFLRGTNRVVRIVSRDTHNPHRFYAEHYGYPIYSEWIKCWVPGVGELAEFSDNGLNWSAPKEFTGYITGSDIEYPFRSNHGGGYRHARPVQKKAEPAPDRNRTFEPAELEAMQEEKIATDDDWRGAIDIFNQTGRCVGRRGYRVTDT